MDGIARRVQPGIALQIVAKTGIAMHAQVRPASRRNRSDFLMLEQEGKQFSWRIVKKECFSLLQPQTQILIFKIGQLCFLCRCLVPPLVGLRLQRLPSRIMLVDPLRLCFVVFCDAFGGIHHVSERDHQVSQRAVDIQGRGVIACGFSRLLDFRQCNFAFLFAPFRQRALQRRGRRCWHADVFGRFGIFCACADAGRFLLWWGCFSFCFSAFASRFCRILLFLLRCLLLFRRQFGQKALCIPRRQFFLFF